MNSPISSASFVGVDIGGTTIKWCVLREGRVERSGSIDTPRVDHHAVLAAVIDLAHTVSTRPTGIGVAVPGTIDPIRRSVLFVPNLPGDWTNFRVADELEDRAGLPVALINDARAFALAEHTTGAAEGLANALFITLGTGVGGAIAFRGEILLDPVDAIGEIGHVPVDPTGDLCACGGRGCLETLASGSAIVSRLARTVAMGQSPILRELSSNGDRPLTAELVAQAARREDPWAIDSFERAGDALGRAAAAAVLLLQLDAVVIGGGLRPAASLYLPRVQAAVDARSSLTGPVRVLSARYGPEAGSVGAAILAASRFPSAVTNDSLKGHCHDLDR